MHHPHPVEEQSRPLCDVGVLRTESEPVSAEGEDVNLCGNVQLAKRERVFEGVRNVNGTVLGGVPEEGGRCQLVRDITGGDFLERLAGLTDEIRARANVRVFANHIDNGVAEYCAVRDGVDGTETVALLTLELAAIGRDKGSEVTAR